ncbi:MAG TPA: hypothetical protein EYN66_22140, partial [Myxococcales bacterium]|nr:hypothetical protein [Myxococcales bacterium]
MDYTQQHVAIAGPASGELTIKSITKIGWLYTSIGLGMLLRPGFGLALDFIHLPVRFNVGLLV